MQYGLTGIPQESCQHLRFEPGETIITEGEEISRVLIMIRGRAKICRDAPNGKSLILCWYISQGVIGEIELLAGHALATATVIAISEVECVALGFSLCSKELERNITFSNCLCKLLAEKLAESSINLSSSALYTAEQRLCSYILQAASDRGLFCDVLTDVACSIGVSYRHLLRMLVQLCERGILEKRESGYKIQNKEILAACSCNNDSLRNGAK